MSDRYKLTIAALGAMMLPYEVGFTCSLLVLSAALATAFDLMREMAIRPPTRL